MTVQTIDLRIVRLRGRDLIVERHRRDGKVVDSQVRAREYPHQPVKGQAARDAYWAAFPPEMREVAA